MCSCGCSILVPTEKGFCIISRPFLCISSKVSLAECPMARMSASVSMSVTLPSGDFFAVPNNLYIIGTMNTADRSVESLDAALRRRFDFVEMMPRSEKVGDVAKPYFERINKRLRILKDDEHQLGHSYFMNITSESDLVAVFRYRVIPLIQEYFFGDMDKIRLVLGDAFCIGEDVDTHLFSNSHADIDIPDKVWRVWGDAEWKKCELEPESFIAQLEKLKS